MAGPKNSDRPLSDRQLDVADLLKSLSGPQYETAKEALRQRLIDERMQNFLKSIETSIVSLTLGALMVGPDGGLGIVREVLNDGLVIMTADKKELISGAAAINWRRVNGIEWAILYRKSLKASAGEVK